MSRHEDYDIGRLPYYAFNDHLLLRLDNLLALPFRRVNYTCMRTKSKKDARDVIARSRTSDVFWSTVSEVRTFGERWDDSHP